MRLSEITRRDIIDLVLLRETPFYGRLDLLDFLKRIWNLSAMPSNDSRFDNAEGDIWQHMINNDDWDNNYLLTARLGLNTSDDQTFLRFLETCLHPLVLSNQQQGDELASEFNKLLRPVSQVDRYTKLWRLIVPRTGLLRIMCMKWYYRSLGRIVIMLKL